jgi:hypothetical protein
MNDNRWFSSLFRVVCCISFYGHAAAQTENVQTGKAQSENGTSQVVAGVLEPDYKYPWLVRNCACGGVPLSPQWILTAAHCVTPNLCRNVFFYRRTDPYTGTRHSGEVSTGGTGPNPGVYIHPEFDFKNIRNDIALVRLKYPGFEIRPQLQTVALPKNPRTGGVVGTVASFSHNEPIPIDKVSVFRAPLPDPETSSEQKFTIFTTDATGSLCEGDSGSGLVTVEDGRATVRGIAVAGSGNCVTAGGFAVDFMDVFAYRDWILQTINTVDYRLAGTTRVRWGGRTARGMTVLGCENPYGLMTGSLNVPGTELGANCDATQTQAVVCSLNSGQQDSIVPLAIKSLTMKTECPPFPATVQSLPVTNNWASFFGPAPTHPDPVGVCLREFTCRVGPNISPPTGAARADPP